MPGPGSPGAPGCSGASPRDPHTGSLVQAIDEALPQTQCRRCGYADCRAYAQALADGQASINRCPPGGAEGVRRLAAITGQPPLALDPQCGEEAPRRLAWIDESACIGCTLCIQACPVDAIAGAPRRMHGVIADWCTGCELCVAPCPTDCIRLVAPTSQAQATGWEAWSTEQARQARARYARRSRRIEQERAAARARPTASAPGDSESAEPAEQAAQQRKQAMVRAALERARLRQASRA